MFKYDLVHYSNVVLLRLPKTPDYLVGKGVVFTAKNGIFVYSADNFELCRRGIFLHGECDNDRDDKYVAYACENEEEAKKMLAEAKEALDEFIEKVIDKKKTRLEVFKELFPDARMNEDGYPIPLPCPDTLREWHRCKTSDCGQCRKDFWDAPAPETFQGGDK